MSHLFLLLLSHCQRISLRLRCPVKLSLIYTEDSLKLFAQVLKVVVVNMVVMLFER